MFEESVQLLAKDVSISGIYAAEICEKNMFPFVASNRPNNQLFVTLNGEREYRTPQGELYLVTHPGDVLLMPVGASYVTTPITPGGCKGVAFLFTLWDEEADREIILDEQVRIVGQDTNGQYAKIFYQILEESLKGGIAVLKAKALVYEVLLSLVSDQSMMQITPQRKSIQPAITYLLEHLQATVPIEALAEMCFMSKSTFHRRFQKELGLSPNAYHLNARIEKSRQLLQSGLYTVEEVAELMGFCDTGYFSRMFFKRTGQHAGNCRNKIAKHIPPRTASAGE